ncbi:response regulator transcription factor [Acidipila sp. EB88]|uniref:response regulator transcription factor n=1 Tax=Acidipila sp. EB88 TaxID=2305226 RepID=UPI0013157C4B|nr:response regulator transcription factor [Acidipila sp. EB88]
MSLNIVNSPGALVYVVEDDDEIARLLAITLARAGFTVRSFSSSTSVLRSAIEQRPAVILLNDSMSKTPSDSTQTPGSMELLRALISEPSLQALRKIMLSIRSTSHARILALDAGADDYLTTPFSPKEVVARVRAVLRAFNTEVTPTLRCGTLLLDLDARRVWLEDRPVEVTTTEFDMLAFLMKHAGRIVSRHALLSELRPLEKKAETVRVVDVYMRRIREKIELNPSNPRLIVTCRGEGYMLRKADPAGTVEERTGRS